MDKINYPTFESKYGQKTSQDPTFEQDRAEAPAPAQPSGNPWEAMKSMQPEEDMGRGPAQVEIAPKPWEYKGK